MTNGELIFKLRNALVQLVGADGRKDLGEMLVAMSALPGTAGDMPAILNAIQVLLETLEPEQSLFGITYALDGHKFNTVYSGRDEKDATERFCRDNPGVEFVSISQGE